MTVRTGLEGLETSAKRLADRSVTSVELVGQALGAAAATQPTLNAFRRIRGEAALAEAAEADRRLATGERRPLLGVPIASIGSAADERERLPVWALGAASLFREDRRDVPKIDRQSPTPRIPGLG